MPEIDFNRVFKDDPPEYIILRRYRMHLRKVMQEEQLHLAAPEMQALAKALLCAVQKGIERDYGPDVALGISIIKSRSFMHRAMRKLPGQYRRGQGFFEVDAQHEVIEWLRKQFVREFAPRGPMKGYFEYLEILNKLRDDWSLMPEVFTLEEAALSGELPIHE